MCQVEALKQELQYARNLLSAARADSATLRGKLNSAYVVRAMPSLSGAPCK